MLTNVENANRGLTSLCGLVRGLEEHPVDILLLAKVSCWINSILYSGGQCGADGSVTCMVIHPCVVAGSIMPCTPSNFPPCPAGPNSYARSI